MAAKVGATWHAHKAARDAEWQADLAQQDARRGAAEQMLTVAQVAQALNVSTETVRRWAHNGTLKAVIVGRIIRIPASEMPGVVSHD
jgi:excisionase family DNA binding protein